MTRRWSTAEAVVLCLCVLGLGAGSVAAHAVLAELGGRSPLAPVSRLPAFAGYYWALALFVVMISWLLLHRELGSFLVITPTALGVLPEGLLALYLLTAPSPSAELTAVRFVEIVDYAGVILLRIISGYTPDRFAVGLIETPTMLGVVGLSSVGYLNGLIWLAVVVAASRFLQRAER